MARPSFRNRNHISTAVQTPVIREDEKLFVGSVRKSQLITTFSFGSVVDFVEDTVIIAAPDYWQNDPDFDERKLYNENLSIITGKKFFVSPKTASTSNRFSKPKTVASYIFPEKLICSTPACGRIFDIKELSSKDRHKCPACKGNLVPSRFVMICSSGHMEDFPYDWWIHRGKKCKSGKASPRLALKNVNNRNDLAGLRGECLECGEQRGMELIFTDSAFKNYNCSCLYPHFRNPAALARYGCKKPVKVRLRSSSGVYFPICKSALLIPPWSKELENYCLKNYDFLINIPENVIPITIRNTASSQTIKESSDDIILRAWNYVKAHKSSASFRTYQDVLNDEYIVLSQSEEYRDHAFSSYRSDIPGKYKPHISRITVVDRLTITQAFCGFSRVFRSESSMAPVFQYKDKEWLPAVELHGEGIFIQFNENAVKTWLQGIGERYSKMEENFSESRFTGFSGYLPMYVMLHTFSHLFIREISNSCGYSAASIHEKIYSEYDKNSGKIIMCGVLIYVSSSDSDCSLGGLISIADNADLLEQIIDNMLERAKWCSGDPLCITSTSQGYKSLNYASCHDCTLLPETSCEIFNILLDRGSIVGLPDNESIGFFL